MTREKIVSITLSNEEYKILNTIRNNSNGSISSVSQVIREIIIPVIMNRHTPENVSPPDVETKSQDDGQNVTEDAEMGRQPDPILLNKEKENAFNFTDIDF